MLVTTKIFRKLPERTEEVRGWRVIKVSDEDARDTDIQTLFTRILDRVYDSKEPFHPGPQDTDRNARISAEISNSPTSTFLSISVTDVSIADVISSFSRPIFIKLYIHKNEQATNSHSTQCGRRNVSEEVDTGQSESEDADHQAHTSNTDHTQESPHPLAQNQAASPQKLPMKDVQDTLRGKCNQLECNCKGYRILHSHQLRIRCEYCNHTPDEHVTLIELGECQECDKCDKYEYDSKEPCSDADCISCGCRAIYHVGAENLPEPAPQPLPQSVPPSGDSPVSQTSEPRESSSLRLPCLGPVLKLFQYEQPGVTIKCATSQELLTITQNFQKCWKPTERACPKLAIDCVYVITNTELSERWIAHQNNLDDKTVEQHYHGTKLACDITTKKTLCDNQDCGICGISTRGLDPECIHKNSNSPFGNGFYLAPNPAKCHEYSRRCGRYRAMLLCDVCPGIKYELKTNDESLRGLPKWYDSIHRVRSHGDELVIYKPDAVMPRYIIVYHEE